MVTWFGVDLAQLWFGLVVLCWVLFFVLEGFDFGVGALHRVLGRDEEGRSAVLRTIGPVWDGNEVWLVAAIGATFGAFPLWYAGMLSSLALPMVAILLLLALRGVALEFRAKQEGVVWRRRASLVLEISSVGVAAVWGAVLVVLVRGLPIGATGEVTGGGLGRTVEGLWHWQVGLGALGGVLAVLWQGASFLRLRTAGALRARAEHVLRVVGPAVAVALGLVAVSTGSTLLLAATLAAVGAVLAARTVHDGWGFACSCLAVALGVVAVFCWHLPDVLPSTLDPAFTLSLRGASASAAALELITGVGVVVLPGVIAYQAWSYWVFRHRLTDGRVAVPA
ncbi:cytochrome d ubiquinol oxidase subunit II [Rhodococcus antarcticus]|uniref:Cytochrome d ubiquinol oxidase subunit II n=1 Tax=Rhodococcus antarcticus TaxID=2987751 RepID=A0ABY6P4F0_9NOCA|nr:cytochrome d ubiquinol oxidase subunit II [Rhodococcus antarcticus]UZJ26374.1 cytochrome d ubiquinol oxidase subunit II [Rhodococcus antarcticus]